MKSFNPYIITFLILLMPSSIYCSGKVHVAKVRIEIFDQKLREFKKDVGRLPTSQEGLRALLEAPANTPGWKGPYLPYTQIPSDPWCQQYQYICPSLKEKKDFDLYSFGPNKVNESGKGDDISY